MKIAVEKKEEQTVRDIGTTMMSTFYSLNTVYFVKLKRSLSQGGISYNTNFGVFKYLIVPTK